MVKSDTMSGYLVYKDSPLFLACRRNDALSHALHPPYSSIDTHGAVIFNLESPQSGSRGSPRHTRAGSSRKMHGRKPSGILT